MANRSNVTTTPGPLALVGSGEFLPGMLDVDARLLEGRVKRVAVIPTAAGTEGDRKVRRWFDLAHQHYKTLGVEVLEVDVRGPEDAGVWQESLEDVGLIYLSGGKPAHLVASIEGTGLMAAITAAWQGGAALAGCSAGAMALAEVFVSSPWLAAKDWEPAFGIVRGLGVLPHFDRYVHRPTTGKARFTVPPPVGITVVGIDEMTALVHDGAWSVQGAGGVWHVADDITALNLDSLPVPA